MGYVYIYICMYSISKYRFFEAAGKLYVCSLKAALMKDKNIHGQKFATVFKFSSYFFFFFFLPINK